MAIKQSGLKASSISTRKVRFDALCGTWAVALWEKSSMPCKCVFNEVPVSRSFHERTKGFVHLTPSSPGLHTLHSLPRLDDDCALLPQRASHRFIMGHNFMEY
ncbi:hypothetical protein J3459_014920 [Metarhizium acridum]|nr:hypothetical protein J3459_014920 [Metarhizium acridum]